MDTLPIVDHSGYLNRPTRAELKATEAPRDRTAAISDGHHEECLCALCLLRLRRYVEVTSGKTLLDAVLTVYSRPGSRLDGPGFPG